MWPSGVGNRRAGAGRPPALLLAGVLATLASCGGSSPETADAGEGAAVPAQEARTPAAGAAAAGTAAVGTAAVGTAARGTAGRGTEPTGGEGPEVPEAARVVLVTGSTSGLGREVARRLAAEGDHVMVHGRDREAGNALVREIEESTPGSARFYRADFARLENVRELAAAIRRDYARLDVLVNNAGILVSPDERPVSEDGHELHFQVNYLAGYLLTRELLPLLEASAPARIVNVSSRSAEPLDFENLMLEEGYSAGRAYGQSKLAQVMFTFELARELEGTGVTVNALHPATLMDTELVREMGMRPRSTVEEGARAVLHLVNGEDVGSGDFYRGTERARAPDPQAYDEEARTRLMRVSDRLTGG